MRRVSKESGKEEWSRVGGGGVRTARVHEEGAHAQQEAGGRASTGGSIVRASEDEGG